MCLEDAYVVWTPFTADVAIISKRELSAALEFREKRKSAELATVGDGKTQEQRRLSMLVTFTTIIVQDDVPVAAAHRAFTRLEDYRRLMGTDISHAGQGVDEGLERTLGSPAGQRSR